MRKINLACSMLAAAVGLTVATTGSASAAAPAPAVNFTAAATPTATVIETTAGSLVRDGNVFKIEAADGTVLAGTDLSFRVDDFVFPIDADITGRKATLTPRLDVAHATYEPVALPYDDTAPWKTPYDREQAAWSRMSSTILTGATLGTLVGGLGGAAAGCVLGGIAGATIAAATIVGMFGPFIPAAAVGCLGGVMAIGALGTVAGQLLITAPAAVAAAVQYFTTVNAPFPTK